MYERLNGSETWMMVDKMRWACWAIIELDGHVDTESGGQKI